MDVRTPHEPPAWTAAQQQALAALGLPVWLRRSAAASAAVAAANGPEPETAVADAAVDTPAARGRPAAARERPAQPQTGRAAAAPLGTRREPQPAGVLPRYNLAFAHLGNVVLVCDRLGDGVGHLARDLSLVVGSRAHAPQPLSLSWPGAAPATLAADLHAAQQAARGLLDRLLDETRPQIVLVVGPDAVRFLLPELDAAGGHGQVEQAGITWLWLVGQRNSPAAKRQMWALLQPQLAAMRAAPDDSSPAP